MKATFISCKVWHKPTGQILYTFAFKMEDGKSAKCYTQNNFGNFARWQKFIHIQQGSIVDGLMWRDEKARLLDGDSEVKIVEVCYQVV